MSNQEKIIKILDPQAGRLEETVLSEKPAENANLFEQAVFGGKKMTLAEAATTGEFPTLLRQGIRSIAFDRYMATPTTYQLFTEVLPSDKQSEDWAEENSLGEFPVVHEGTAYPIAKQDLDRAVNIRNFKRGMVLEVTEEMIKFNKTNLLKRQAAQLGRVAANTREQAVYSVISTAGNYTRNSTTGDNDIGANTAATQFGPVGLNLALTTLRTMKDRKSGAYLNVNPNTLIVTPYLEMAAKQLLFSPGILPVGDPGSAATVYGGGTTNPFRGAVSQIIVSPRLGSAFQWVLCEAKQFVVLQEVEGFTVLTESVGSATSESYFVYDVIRYRGRDWFGTGMLNDRFAFYSSDATGPVIG